MTAPGLLEEFEAQRSRLFGIAYRLLGSAEEAEDIVQEVFLRWAATDRATLETPAAWLTTVTTNLCLNVLDSARARRERYVGIWLPEPVLTSDGGLGPADAAEQRELISLGLLVLMEQLTPVERAVFVLKEAFGYSHREIAGIVGVSEVNSRQLHRRARRQLGGPGADAGTPDRVQWRRLVERFVAAAHRGDVAELEAMLAADATAWADGGGKATSARRPVSGRAKVARLMKGLFTGWTAGIDIGIAEINGETGLLGWHGDTLLGIMTFQVVDGQITAMRSVANPDKLGFITRQARGGKR